MKIAIVAPMDPRTGISNYSETLAIELLKLGQDVDIVSPENSINSYLNTHKRMNHVRPENYTVGDYDVTHFQLANSPLHEFQLHILSAKNEDLFRNSNIITTVHDARNFDVFQYNCLKCLSFGINSFKSSLSLPYNLVDRGFQRVSNLLILHNNAAIDEYRNRYNLEKMMFKRVLHPAYRIPGENIVKTESKGTKTVLSPGYISPYKGQDILIRAAVDIDMDFKLVFMGKILDPGYGAYLNQLVMENGLEDRVEFLGFVSSEEFINNIDNAEAVLVPRLTSPWLLNKPLFKLRRFMGLDTLINQSTSGVLTKALASGKPVICSENQGFADYVQEDRGLMCDDRVESWSEAIKYMLENPNKVKEMSINSKRFEDNVLDPTKIAEEHLRIYEEYF
ncbi:MAG: glycosyltransferase family 4 protein [Methanobacterium sp.]|nr:glycosyltransferase family 4 protein [Methanobacterium sp.]